MLHRVLTFSPQQPTRAVFRFLNTDMATVYGDSGRAEYDAFVRMHGDFESITQCQYCQSNVSNWSTFQERSPEYDGQYWRDAESYDIHLAVCSVCGWFRYKDFGWMSDDQYPQICDNIATLGKNSAIDYATPFIELDQYLKKNWNERSDLSAAKAEQLVADVFKAHLNCEVIYTTNGVYTPDGGVDFVLIDSNVGIEYAFQMKRRVVDSPERIQLVREFIGAMANSRFKYGYYVTTADRFTTSAWKELEQSAANQAAHNLHISLVDGNALRSLLKQRKALSATVWSIRSRFRPDTIWNREKTLDQMISEAFQI